MCAALREPAPRSPLRVAGTLADGLAADPLFCDLLANLHLHLEHEVDLFDHRVQHSAARYRSTSLWQLK